MKKFVFKILLFVLISLSIYVPIAVWVLPDIITIIQGPSTLQQIEKSFQNAAEREYELVILGNSGSYRGLNPEKFELTSYNFSHDNDTYNQIYHKLKWLEKKDKKIKYLILSVDYFQFSYLASNRNYAYNLYFNKSYKNDYMNIPLVQFTGQYNLLEPNRLKYLRDVKQERTKEIYLKENGQYVYPGQANESDTYEYDINRLPLQEEYFKEVLAHCKNKNIEVFLCMPPCRKNALENYSSKEMNEFNEFINSNTSVTVHYLNYAHQKGWKLADFTDITHLNERAADLFSKQVSDSIVAIIKE